MQIEQSVFRIEMTRQELSDLCSALNELNAMREKYRYPEWANGFGVDLADRVEFMRVKLSAAINA